MKIKLLLTSLYCLIFLSSTVVCFGQETLRNKEDHANQDRMLYSASGQIYFPLLLEENQEHTRLGFEAAMERFYAAKTERQKFLSAIYNSEMNKGVIAKENAVQDSVFYVTTLMIHILRKDEEKIQSFLQAGAFAGIDAFTDIKKEEVKTVYTGTEYSREEVAKNAKKMDASERQGNLEERKVKNAFKNQMEFGNYAFMHPELFVPIFADKSLYAHSAGDYEANMLRYILSYSAFLTAYPDHAKNVHPKMMELYNRGDWKGFYDQMLALYEKTDIDYAEKIKKINYIQ